MTAVEEEDGKEYRWETGYEKTWEAIREDDEGLLEGAVAEMVQRAKRRRLEALSAAAGHVRLGMMRHVIVVVDCSDAMLDQDLKPTRQLCATKLLCSFIDEFFDQNPIGQLGVVVTRNKRAERASQLGGNAQKHVAAVQAHLSRPEYCAGEPSLQNALELALTSLRSLPTHASREIVVLLASLTTCDPGDITATIESLKSCNVRVSVIGLAAEVRVCAALCRETGGSYSVAMDDRHLRDLLREHVLPPPSLKARAAEDEAALVKMGFPHSANAQQGQLSMCMCHLDSPATEPADTSASASASASGCKLRAGGYFCPQCRSNYCQLPAECRVCGLTLISAPHLARSYHHLFPVRPFSQRPAVGAETGEGEGAAAEAGVRAGWCFACRKSLAAGAVGDKFVYECEKCHEVFCLDCDLFIHDTLHTCPGCTTDQRTFQQLST
ncbi:general transcription factor IIH subunit 2 [Nilaparvata lugens]|uniref:general transcription factor IIH subunit 2 n=1 Tax=Nilaparvata lugens TaxID=108931 RepID=UPI00193E5BE0|nr:general transcription factor IIH subunit 2 [Nilaparvata lugens]XP_039283627.1 general transcription factor IIH subunit 2 [Nilaparvata lugens]